VKTVPRTLASGQRYLLENPNLLKEMTPQKRGMFYRGLRKKGLAELDDLTFLAKALPEKQQAQVFSKERMRILFDALFAIKGQLDHEDFEKRRKRLLQIFAVLFSNYICNTTYVLNLAKKEQRILSASGRDAHNMQALNLAASSIE
jgi:hypothetical protein